MSFRFVKPRSQLVDEFCRTCVGPAEQRRDCAALLVHAHQAVPEAARRNVIDSRNETLCARDRDIDRALNKINQRIGVRVCTAAYFRKVVSKINLRTFDFIATAVEQSSTRAGSAHVEGEHHRGPPLPLGHVAFQHFLAIRMDLPALSLDRHLVPVQESPRIQVLPLHHPLQRLIHDVCETRLVPVRNDGRNPRNCRYLFRRCVRVATRGHH